MYIVLIAEYCIEVVNALLYIYILGLNPLSKPARAEMQSIVISLVLGARYTKRKLAFNSPYLHNLTEGEVARVKLV